MTTPEQDLVAVIAHAIRDDGIGVEHDDCHRTARAIVHALGTRAPDVRMVLAYEAGLSDSIGLKEIAAEGEHVAALGQAYNDGFNEGKAALDDQLDELHRALAEAKVELERLERLHPVDSAPSAG